MSSQENAVAEADDPSKEGGEATPYNELNIDPGTLEAFAVRLDHLEAYQKQYVEDFLESKVLGMIEGLQDRVAELETELDSVVGLAEGEPTSPEKRAVDLAMTLIRRARNRVDEDRYAMWYKQVEDALAQAGHGPPVHRAWAFDAMEAVAEAPGFGTTSITNADGREVKAVTVNLAELPSEDRSAVSNDIITAMGEAASQSNGGEGDGVISEP